MLHLREGPQVLGVEVVEWLVDPALLHVSEALTSCVRQEQLLGFLQLDAPHTLPDLPQAPSWRQIGEETRVKPLGQPDLAPSLHWGGQERTLSWCISAERASAAGSFLPPSSNLMHAVNKKGKKTNKRFSNSPASVLWKSSKTVRARTGENVIFITSGPLHHAQAHASGLCSGELRCHVTSPF